MPIVLDQHGRILDGHHRWRIAGELGLSCPSLVRHVTDEDEAAEVVRTLNMDRRHLDAEQRRVIAATLRREGHNLRAIAHALGANPSTILRDVRGVASATPERVRGRDNKLYPATRRTFEPVEVSVELIERLPTKPDLGGGVSHPSRFSDALLPVLLECLLGDDGWPLVNQVPLMVLDVFAGTGRIHELRDLAPGRLRTIGVEIEPEWAHLHPNTLVGDALALPIDDGSVHAIVTSPTYGNRLADHHEARDPSLRRSYRHDLGRELHEHNSGRLAWGEEYRRFHLAAWREAARVLVPHGRLILNMKDHLREGQRQHVSGWHATALCRGGFRLLDVVEVETPGMRAGANAEARMPGEFVFVFELE